MSRSHTSTAISSFSHIIKMCSLLVNGQYHIKRVTRFFFEQGRHLRKPLRQQQRPLSRDPEYVKSEPRTTIFKMATISPRPSKQSEKGNPSFKVGFTKCTSKDIKDGKLLNKKFEKELACSPIFQILGELS